MSKSTFPPMLFVCAVTGFVSLAHAEGGCPPGQYPQQGRGWRSCTPPVYEEVAPAPGRWISRWGAVATHEPKQVIGVATAQLTKKAAKRLALADCEFKSGEPCKVELTYKNACAAFAASDTGYTVVSRPDLLGAQIGALAQCILRKISNCEVVYSACSNADFVP